MPISDQSGDDSEDQDGFEDQEQLVVPGNPVESISFTYNIGGMALGLSCQMLPCFIMFVMSEVLNIFDHPLVWLKGHHQLFFLIENLLPIEEGLKGNR